MAVDHKEVFIAPETFNWVAPTGVTSVAAEAIGSGGGGGCDGVGDAGGAGGGAYSKLNSYSTTPGNNYSITVGARGTRAATNCTSTGSDGGAGGDSNFIDTATLLAKGGGAGQGDGTAGSGGASASGVGDTKYSGGNGADGVFGGAPGGGGGGAGSTGAGGNASTTTGGTGTSELGGNGGDAVDGGAGASGFPHGGGGAGSEDTSGGLGGIGAVRLAYSYSGVGLVGTGAQITGTGTSLTPVLPAGVAANDLILIATVNRSAGDTSETSTGYAERASVNLEIGANDMTLTLLWKVAGAGESNPSVSTGDGAGGWSAQCIVYRNIDTSDPFAVASATTGTNAAAATLTPTGVTTDTALALAISIVSTADDNRLGMSAAQAFSGRMHGQDYNTVTGVDHSVGFGDKPIVTAGTYTSPTWEQILNGNDTWCYISDAIKPAVAVAGGGEEWPTFMQRGFMSPRFSG